MCITSQRRDGFTIVELLIVIVVIGILAAITIVAFNGVQDKANHATLQSDMRTAGSRIMQFQAENDRFPINTTELASLSLKFTKNAYATTTSNALAYCSIPSGTGQIFVIAGASKTDKAGFYYSSTEGLKQRAWWGAVGNTGLCPQVGVDHLNPGYFHSWGHTAASGWNPAWVE